VVKVAAPLAYESVLNSLSTGSLQSHIFLKKFGVNAATGTPLASGIVWLIVAHGMIKIGAQSLQGMLDLSFNAAAQPAVRRIGTRTLGVLLSQELGFHLGMNTGATTRVVDRGMRGITAVLSRIVLQVGFLVPRGFFVTISFSARGPECFLRRHTSQLSMPHASIPAQHASRLRFVIGRSHVPPVNGRTSVKWCYS
jgi:hypothetical protein